MTERTADEIGLLRSIALTKYAQLIGPAPAILNDLTHDGLLEWKWNGGIPVYELTAAGYALFAPGKDQSR